MHDKLTAGIPIRFLPSYRMYIQYSTRVLYLVDKPCVAPGMDGRRSVSRSKGDVDVDGDEDGDGDEAGDEDGDEDGDEMAMKMRRDGVRL
jgi:hypothetical protein